MKFNTFFIHPWEEVLKPLEMNNYVLIITRTWIFSLKFKLDCKLNFKCPSSPTTVYYIVIKFSQNNKISEKKKKISHSTLYQTKGLNGCRCKSNFINEGALFSLQSF